ncbi:MAG TPA: glycoside hydrolase family 127 protein [Clostridiales bacterium]|nr:glycoside hydrolase family 127 protein [Clostridiales bacterium]
MNREIDLKNINIKDDFWTPRQGLISNVVIPYQEKILDDQIPGVEKSHAFANFRITAGMEEGEFYGMVFQDSDVAKWLEGVAYSLAVKPDPELEKRADEIIASIEKAQQPDGYLNTYFTIKEPEHKWQNLQECHELYCAGHMMEAAVAYYEATGKDKLLKVMERMAAHIGDTFGPDKRAGIPGHQEIEVGLMRLYHVTGKEQYAKLAQYFIDERGKNPDFFKEEKEKRGWTHFGMNPNDTKYSQCFAPVREQKTAEGHSVRAVYMYTAMAYIAEVTGEKELLQACNTLWDNITKKRMYITGGIGSTAEGEAFSIDYDLPNDTVYAETCASIGLVFFARKMLDIHPSNKYADVMEKVLYNGILSGMQLDGKRFFYVNPLEVNPEISGKLHGYKHVLPERPGWYACACCPPNLVRLLMSLGKYAWSESENTIYSHLYIGSSAKLKAAEITVESKYPWEGKVIYHIDKVMFDEDFTLAVRIPSYAKNEKVILNGSALSANGLLKEGYFYLKKAWVSGDQLEISFDLPVRRIRTNSIVRDNAGCVALMRGPFVYCFEGVDNGESLQELRIPKNAEILVANCEEAPLEGLPALIFDGVRVQSGEELYTEEGPEYITVPMKAIPYFAWGNRGINQMKVWMLEV